MNPVCSCRRRLLGWALKWRFIPPLGMIDLSPAVLMLLLIILLRFILPALGWAGFSLDGLWPIYMVAIPASWFWLILLGLVGTREAAGDPVLDAA